MEGKLKLKGLIADIPNKANIIFPKEVLEKATKYAKEEMKHGDKFLYFGTPVLNDIVGKIKDIDFDGNEVTVEADLLELETDKAQVVKALMETGINFYLSAQCFGSVTENELGQKVIRDLKHLDFSLGNFYPDDVEFVNNFLEEGQKEVSNFSEET